jgi:hypothetical protein
MSCILGNGISLGCKDSIGGVKAVYIASYKDNVDYTYGAIGDPDEDVILTMTGTENFFKFAMRSEQGEFTQNGVHSVENGTNYWDQVVNLIFTKNDASDRNTLKVLAQSTLLIVVQDQNNKYWLVGQTNGADLTASTQSAGKMYGDLNGTTVSFLGKDPAPAREISSDAFDILPKT